MLAVLEEQRVSAKALKLVREVQDADRRSRQSGKSADFRLGLSAQAALLARMQDRGLAQQSEESRGLLSSLKQTSHERDSIARSLAATPTEESIKDVGRELAEATKAYTRIDEAANRLDAKIGPMRNALEGLESKRDKLVRKQIDRDIRQEETQRMAKLATAHADHDEEFFAARLRPKSIDYRRWSLSHFAFCCASKHWSSKS